MSWLSISLPNPFKSLQLLDDDSDDIACASSEQQRLADDDDYSTATATVTEEESGGSGGAKDDLSGIGETIGRQLRSVGTFLAPPPVPTNIDHDREPEPDSSAAIVDDDILSPSSSYVTLDGIRSDLTEISENFKSSLSLISSNRAVSEISKLASNFFQLNEDGGGGDSGGSCAHEACSAGISEEVVEFVDGISRRPLYWTDFPLSLNEDFLLSPAQAEHASIIEQLVPNLATLRVHLKTDMSCEKFWMIYFILLIPRLEENDLQLLSTPEIIEVRDTLLKMLKEKRDPMMDNTKNPHSSVCCQYETEGNSDDEETKSSPSKEMAVLANSVNFLTKGKDDTMDKQIKMKRHDADSLELLRGEDEISFSDLEDDDDLSYQRGRQNTGASILDTSTEWVQLTNNTDLDSSYLKGRHSISRDSSSDWLAVDEFD